MMIVTGQNVVARATRYVLAELMSAFSDLQDALNRITWKD